MKIGIIGGSGLYDIEGLEDRKWVKVDTPFGQASDEFLTACYRQKHIVFLPRHGRHHSISPSKINYRANIYGMKYLGVERIISLTACGSLKEDIKPLDFVIPDQFIDRTKVDRESTFFDEGLVAHVGFAKPLCGDLSDLVYNSARGKGFNIHKGGIYINMEGPQFSTIAESNLYRSWGASIIGMTNLTEAKLAREAEICYLTLAAVTDYDCWRQTGQAVTVEMVLNNLRKNSENSKDIIKAVLSAVDLDKDRVCECKDSLKYALVTRPEFIPESTKKKLDIFINKYIDK